MSKRLDHKLDCKGHGTIYRGILEAVQSHTLIQCSSCGEFLGRGDDLERDFNQQVRQHGMLEMYDGQHTEGMIHANR